MTDLVLLNTYKYYRGLPHQKAAIAAFEAEIKAKLPGALELLADGWRKSPDELLTIDDLTAITTAKRDRLLEFLPHLNEGFRRYEVNTPLRIAHFLAQILHESGELSLVRELWGPTEAQQGYEGRADLGNTEAGDGFRFRGRGLIQITGRSNYREVGTHFKIDCLKWPEKLEQLPYSVLTAFWFWQKKKLNDWADKDDVEAITRLINGGYNGLSDRRKYLARAKEVLL